MYLVRKKQKRTQKSRLPSYEMAEEQASVSHAKQDEPQGCYGTQQWREIV